ncbi:MAG: mechanosensitive ion channel family protein [Enterococcus sp.]
MNEFFNQTIFKQPIVEMLSQKALRIGIIIVLWIVIVNVLLKIISTMKKRYKSRKWSTLLSVFRYLAKFGIGFIAIYQLLIVFEVNVTSLLAVASIGSIAIGFGAQTLVKDIVSGIFILLEDQYGVNDYVEINEKLGVVEGVNLRTTLVRGIDGDFYIIPNGEIRTVTNLSKGYNRAVVDIGIAYDQNINEAMDSINKELKVFNEETPALIRIPEIKGVEELGETAVIIRIIGDCEIGENWNVERALRGRLKTRFDEDGIQMPYAARKLEFANSLQVKKSG